MRQYGYCYASWSANHSDMLSLLFHRLADKDPNLIAKGITNDNVRAVERIRQAEIFSKELMKFNGEFFVLSAEKASSFGISEIHELIEFLEKNSAAVSKVICYVRDPVRYSTSMAQQRLKTNATLAQIRQNPPLVLFRKKLKPWLKVFGKDILSVRVFEDAIASPGGLINDFLIAIGLAPNTIVESKTIARKNTSMSMEMALLVDAVNQVRPLINEGRISHGRCPQDVNQIVRSITGSPFTLGVETEKKIRSSCKEDVSWLEKTFDIKLPNISVKSENKCEANWPEETYRELGLLLFELFSENKKLKNM
jgi:hypothetical protein